MKVIAKRVYSAKVIINNKTGYLVEHENWHAMADAAEDLIKDSIKSDILGKNARHHIVDMMHPKILNDHEKKSYDTLIDNF